MNKFFIIFILFGIPTLAQAVAQDLSLKTLTTIDLELQGIGLTYEPRLISQILPKLSLGAGAGYGVSESSVRYRFYITDPAFYFFATSKFYFNRKSRLARGKKIHPKFRKLPWNWRYIQYIRCKIRRRHQKSYSNQFTLGNAKIE